MMLTPDEKIKKTGSAGFSPLRKPATTCAACRQTPTQGKPYCPPCWQEIQRKRKEVSRYGP